MNNDAIVIGPGDDEVIRHHAVILAAATGMSVSHVICLIEDIIAMDRQVPLHFKIEDFIIPECSAYVLDEPRQPPPEDRRIYIPTKGMQIRPRQYFHPNKTC